MAFDFDAAENAVRSWLTTSSGVTFIWANQSGPQPAMPYGTVKISGPLDAGARPALHLSTDLTRPAGQEVEQKVVLHQELVASCQVFAAPTKGAATARALLQPAKAALFLPSTLEALRAAGLAVVEAGDMQDLTALLETAWQSRAVMDVRFRLVDTATERTGYIATAEVSGQATT